MNGNKPNPKKLQVQYFNGIENEKSILVFDELKKCEQCGIAGSYVIENDPIVGICLKQVKKEYTNIEELEN